MIVPNVFPSMKGASRVALIGDAPGIDELRKGEPFVGPSGKVLNQILRTANIERDTLFLGNVFPAKAPGNDVTPWMKNAELTGKALTKLEKDLKRFKPNIIVPMGDTALWALTGETGAGSQRGNIAEATRIMPGTKILPTYHPQFVQKVWKMFVVVVGDMQKAWRQGSFPEIRWPVREFMVEPTFAEALTWIQECHGADLLSVDIETGWGLITCIGLGIGDRSMCIPFVDLRQPDRSYWRSASEEAEIWFALKRLMADKGVPKLGQNFSGYDAHWMNDMGLQTYNFREDTMLMSHALYAEMEKSLGFLATRYADFPSWKSWTQHNKTDKKDDEQ